MVRLAPRRGDRASLGSALPVADDHRLALRRPEQPRGAAEVERANGELARAEQIKAFRILPKALDPEEDGEPVTPTRKVKRHLMYERFKPLVESMYDDREEKLIAGIALSGEVGTGSQKARQT